MEEGRGILWCGGILDKCSWVTFFRRNGVGPIEVIKKKVGKMGR